MNYLEAKSVVLPVAEGIATAQRLLSEREARRNPRLFRCMAKVQVRLAELGSILQRLKRSQTNCEDKEERV